MSALAVDSWWSRTLRRLGLSRALPTSHDEGPEYAAAVPYGPHYSHAQAMSAYGSFPYVFAAVGAIAQDVSGLPLIVQRRSRSGKVEVIEDHPLYDLLERPSTRIDGGPFRAQLTVDRLLTGSAFAVLVGGARPVSLYRLHPEKVTIEALSDGQPSTYVYGGGVQMRYPWDAVLHWRTPSWTSDPAHLHGQGLVQALHRTLSAELATWQRQQTSAESGRPAAIVGPKDDGEPISGSAIEEIRKRIEELAKKSHGGMLVLPRALSFTPIAWSPTDLGADALHLRAREEVIAATGVPPVRLGLETANYATAREQMRLYWHDTVGGHAQAMCLQWTRLARMYDATLEVVPDFSQVPALQWDRGERLQRVQSLWLMGIDLREALDSEGFENIPTAPDREPAPTPAAPVDEEGTRALARLLAQGVQRSVEVEDRDALWHSYIREVHTPSEKKLAALLAPHLAAYGREVAGRVPEVLYAQPDGRGAVAVVQRDVTDAVLTALLGTEEAARLRRVVGDAIVDVVRRAFTLTARSMGVDLAFDPAAAGVDGLIGLLVANVSTYTRAAVASIVGRGLAEGWTVAEMQERLITAEAFSATRALRIARTETTSSVSRGNERARGGAVALGLVVEKRWLTARDENVREDHQLLEGQQVPHDQPYTVPSGPHAGYQAASPGNFGIAALNVNCRCTETTHVVRS